MTRRRTAASLTLTGAPGLTATPADPGPVAAGPSPDVPDSDPPPDGGDPFASVPDLPQRRTTRKKAFFYLRADLAEQAEKIARYAEYQLGMKKGEVQDVILTVGLSQPMEVLRALRERSTT